MIKYSFFSKILLLLISIAFWGLDLSAYEKIKLTQKEKIFIQNHPVIILGANFKTIGFFLLKFYFSRVKTILTRPIRFFIKIPSKS